ncbi:hypothetical protein SAMN05443144_101374 [Fodinibius roseus]|uniref:Uncharacterized protein n=1 Tax=Fodinibius roseus TaxID=1194090 RepID=A0A1M4TSL0_9BACT|nr:hypothetical protein SAMN05443144_101374 [Fodinibius roseus]
MKPNQTNLPTTVLEPGEIYHNLSVYHFIAEQS